MISETRKKHLAKLAEMRRGMKLSAEWRKNIGLAQVGKVRSEEFRKRVGEFHRGKHLNRGKCPRGENAHQWMGGGWDYWQKEIRIRDHFTCQVCGLYDPEIVEVAHIQPIGGIKNRFTSGHPLNGYENLITLCPNDHARFDKHLIKLKEKGT